MVTRQVYDFSDWTDLTNAGFVNLSDPAEDTLSTTINTTSGVYSDQLTAAIIALSDFSVYARFKTSDTGRQGQIGVWVTDGSVWYRFGIDIAAGEVVFSGHTNNGRLDFFMDEQNDQTINITTNEWVWIKTQYVSATTTWYLSYNIDNVATKPTDWTAAPDCTMVKSIGTLTELGIWAKSHGANPAPTVFADDMEIEAVGGGSGNTGLNAAIEIKHTYARLATGAQGAVRYELSSPRDVDTTTIQAEIGNQVSIQNANEINIFKGEVKSYSNIDPHGKILEGVSQGNKLTKLRTNTNALTLGIAGELQYANGSVIYDRSKSFTINEFQNKPILFTRFDLRKYSLYPTAAAFITNIGGALVPDTIHSSDVTKLYFFIEDGTANDSDNGVVAVEGGNTTWGIELTYDTYFRTGTSWTKINGVMIAKFEIAPAGETYNSVGEENPEIRIYNYNLAAWEILFDLDNFTNDFPQNGPNTGWNTEAHIWGIQIDVYDYIINGLGSGTLADYFDIGAENAAGYKKHEMKIAVHNTDYGTGNMGVYFAPLFFQTTTDQFSEYGVENVASNTATTITLDNATIAGVQMPSLDGFARLDTYFIGEYITGLFASIVTNSGTPLSGDIDATDSGIVVDINDMTYSYMFDVLQRWASLLNAIWWVDPRDDTIYFRSIDKLVDSNITLTEADIIDFDPGAYSHTITGSNLRSQVVAVGAVGLFKAVNTSIEFGLDGGDEQEIYINPNLKTLNLVERWANKKKIIHENANREVRLTLNYTKPQQDYSALFIGKWVKVNIASQVEADYISDTLTIATGKLLVIAMEYNLGKEITGGMEYITLTLQRRYSA